MNKLVFASAHELAAAIRQRHVSAVEVLEAHLAQVARHNEAINAVVTLDAERARRRAQEADAALARGEVWGPLHGVPFTAKDSIETADLRTTSGYPPLANHVPSVDAPVIARVRAAGGIMIGKTNLPTLAGDAQSDNPLFGRSNNPWDLLRTPGGSSGGGAAAVAAGFSPLDIGSDYGGSLRIPAHYCGIYTIKPTDHRVSETGHIPELPGTPRVRHMPQMGPLARSVADLTLALRLIAGPDGQDWEIPPAPLEPAAERSLREVRLAWTDDFGGVPVTAATSAALTKLADTLQSLQTPIERCLPAGFDFTTVWETWGELSQAEVGATMSWEEEEASARHDAALDSDVAISRGIARARHATMRQYARILMQRDALITALERFFDRWDALLCPVTVGPAFPHCPTGTPIDVDGHTVPYLPAILAYTSPFNLTGHPAVVVPVGRSAEGLPIGLQIVGRRWGEMQLLAIAERVAELVGPWQGPPGY